MLKNGPDGIRTHDLLLRRQSRYPDCATGPLLGVCNSYATIPVYKRTKFVFKSFQFKTKNKLFNHLF